MGLSTFATVQELLWYNCSPVCGLSSWWLYGGAHTHRLPGLLQPEPPSPWQVVVELCLRRRHSNTQSQVSLSFLWGLWVLVHTKFCLSPPSMVGMRFESKHDFIPLNCLVGTSPLPLSTSGQTEWKPQSQKTNQTDLLDHSLV